MSVETDFYTAVTGDATISAIVSTRLYPVILPDNATFPALSYMVFSGVPIGSGGCTRHRVQVDCYATTYAVAKSLRDGLVTLANATGNWTYVEGPDFFEDDTELYHQPVDILIA